MGVRQSLGARAGDADTHRPGDGVGGAGSPHEPTCMATFEAGSHAPRLRRATRPRASADGYAGTARATASRTSSSPERGTQTPTARVTAWGEQAPPTSPP